VTWIPAAAVVETRMKQSLIQNSMDVAGRSNTQTAQKLSRSTGSAGPPVDETPIKQSLQRYPEY
jgi:hypothetical protein